AGVGPVGTLRRDEREHIEDLTLAPGATRAREAGRRASPEEPDLLRTCFERDRDRILHATAFRRLAGKTQVFIFPQDHQRTRLTPDGEVVSWADRIAYVCHDFEDAVRAGIVTPAMLPARVRRCCGGSRGGQLGAFIGGVLEATAATGEVGMTEELALALAEFR